MAAAHARILHEGSIQVTLPDAGGSTPPPGWLLAVLDALGQVLRALAPVVKILFWAALAVGGLALLVVLARQLRGASGAGRTARTAALSEIGPETSAQRAHARLGDADRLASKGLYEDAAHLLLLCGIDDLEAGRPGRIPPSSTSRDIVKLVDLPNGPRAAFAKIADVVERALFAGRPVGPGDWADCRSAYESLTQNDGFAASTSSS